MTSCNIKILNKSYEIKCPKNEEENLKRAAEVLNGQLQSYKKKFKRLDEFENLLLAALHICHELISCQKQQEQQRHQVTQFINSLENRINQVVNGQIELDKVTEEK